MLVSRLSGTAIQFLMQLLAARLLGSQAVGLLGVAQANVLFFGSFASAGAPQLVLRRTARRRQNNHQEVRAKWLSFGTTLASWVGACVALGFLLYWIVGQNELGPIEAGVLGLFMAFGIVAYGIGKVYFEYLKGEGRSASALSLEYTVPYAVTLVSVLLLARLDQSLQFVIIPAASFCLAVIAITYVTGRKLRSNSGALPARGVWSRTCRNWKELAAFTAVQAGNQAMFALPVSLVFAISGAAAAGIIVVVLKLVGLTATLSAVFSAYFSPKVVDAQRSADKSALRRLFLQSMLLNGSASAVLCVAMSVWPSFFLGIFGAEFSSDDAMLALQISCAGRFVRQYAGMTEVFLGMTGHAGWDLISQALSVAILVGGLGVIAITGFGSNLALVALVVAVSTTIRPLVSLPVVFAKVLSNNS